MTTTEDEKPSDPDSRPSARGGLPEDDTLTAFNVGQQPYWWLSPEKRAAKLREVGRGE
jgi:hypothetical protein